jgi:hypothetical protein
MYTTVELRWFIRGSIPSEVRDWFASATGSNGLPTQRSDIYLAIPGNDSIGIKRREQYLEIKGRYRELGLVVVHQDVRGRMEYWRKWRFTLAEDRSDYESISSHDGHWLSIRKERLLQRFAICEDDNVVLVDAADGSLSGCEVELTTIDVLEERWWTFAFESFGAESLPGQNLFLVGDTIMSQDFPLALSEELSCGYPEWLKDRVKQG